MACQANSEVKLNTTAEALYKSMIHSENIQKHPKGEMFCWHANFGMGQFMEAYQATQDTNWLEWGMKYGDFLVSKMDTAPDGYRGWIGPYIYDPAVWCDVHVGDAILIRNMLDFSVVVLKDEKLKKTYGPQAQQYVDLAKKDFVEKWDQRQTWYEDGPYGGYMSFEKYLENGKTDQWKTLPDVKGSHLSLPFNKQNDAAQVLIRLYRITGDRFYRDRAEKIFFRMKSSFQYFDNHYVWNYWEPLGPWDIDLDQRNVKHWVNVHPYRDYQAGEIDQMVDAYHCGIVFDSADIQRIINTNLEVMWNKDREKPQFVNSNATHSQIKQVPKGEEWQKLAGTLWSALIDFDKTIRDLSGLQFKNQKDYSIARLYFEKCVLKDAPSFKRKYPVDPVTIPAAEFTECRDINMAVVLPGRFKPGEKVLIVNKSWKPGEMEIALYSQDGKTKLSSIYKGQVPSGSDGLAGIFVYEWDGKDTAKKQYCQGEYRVRWTMGKDYRERRISIQ